MSPATPFDPALCAEALSLELDGLTAGGRVLHTRFGRLHLHPALPFLDDPNVLIIERWPAGAGARVLLDETGPPFRRFGAGDPRFLCVDPALLPQVIASLERRGYTARPILHMMRLRGDLPPASGTPTWEARSVEEMDGIDALHLPTLAPLGETLAWQVLNARRQELDEALDRRWIVARRPGGTGVDATAALCLRGRVGSIQWVRTGEGARRAGLGRAVTLEAARRLEAQGTQALSLLVEARNAGAVALYDGLGFRVITQAVYLDPP